MKNKVDAASVRASMEKLREALTPLRLGWAAGIVMIGASAMFAWNMWLGIQQDVVQARAYAQAAAVAQQSAQLARAYRSQGRALLPFLMPLCSAPAPIVSALVLITDGGPHILIHATGEGTAPAHEPGRDRAVLEAAQVSGSEAAIGQYLQRLDNAKSLVIDANLVSVTRAQSSNDVSAPANGYTLTATIGISAFAIDPLVCKEVANAQR